MTALFADIVGSTGLGERMSPDEVKALVGECVTRMSRVIEEFGVGLAAAVLIDATIIRGVLLPASMKLLGNWNWYLPKPLQWLPRFQIEPASQPAVEASGD